MAPCVQFPKHTAQKEPVGLVFGRAGGDDYAVHKIHEWCRVANALHTFKAFGSYVCFTEMCEIVNYIENSTKEELDARLEQIRNTFDIMDASYDSKAKHIEWNDLE